MKRPLIGVSTMNHHTPDGTHFLVMWPTYIRALEAAGAVPLLIPLTDDLTTTRALYELCDGILIPGGEDVDPQQYGEEPHEKLDTVDRQRDSVELQLARWANEDSKPLLGICRGLQLINVALGGTLYQDLPSQLPESINHRANFADRRWEQVTHGIEIEPDSRLAGLLGGAEIGGNTMHHQAVKDLAPVLRAVGRAPDGVVEAFEGSGGNYIMALQCHPEHLWDETEPRWGAVFADFVAACRAA
jgi:putative glutamine amidotransferase